MQLIPSKCFDIQINFDSYVSSTLVNAEVLTKEFSTPRKGLSWDIVIFPSLEVIIKTEDVKNALEEG